MRTPADLPSIQGRLDSLVEQAISSAREEGVRSRKAFPQAQSDLCIPVLEFPSSPDGFETACSAGTVLVPKFFDGVLVIKGVKILLENLKCRGQVRGNLLNLSGSMRDNNQLESFLGSHGRSIEVGSFFDE